MTYFAHPRSALPPLERDLGEAIHGGPRPGAGRIGAWLRARGVPPPCRVLAVYLAGRPPAELARALRGRAAVLAVHPNMAYVFFRDDETALTRMLRGKRLSHGPAQSIDRAAETVARIQNAIVALRARQLAPRERQLGPLAFEDEVRARARAAEALRTGARGWKAPVAAWCELVLVRHYRQLNTVRRKYAEFLALLTRDLDGGFGLDYPVARALRELYATFALQDLAARFPALLAPLVPLLARRGPGALEAGARSEPVARALAYLQAHATEPIGLAETAAAVHFSAPHLSRRFHRETGRTLTEHLQGLRVAHAQRLLAESGEGVLTVALRSGFPTLEHFYRVFKKRTGMTPRAWRLARHA